MPETLDDTGFATLTAPDTLTLTRLLPGPVERVWAYLTQGELRRQWLAAGEMELTPGAPFELVWRNDELSSPPGTRPAGFPAEHRMASRIVACDPPHRLVFPWNGSGDVAITLVAQGQQVLLTLTHHRIPERPTRLMIGAGWHMHLNILRARLSGTAPAPFWDSWLHLRGLYDQRLPA